MRTVTGDDFAGANIGDSNRVVSAPSREGRRPALQSFTRPFLPAVILAVLMGWRAPAVADDVTASLQPAEIAPGEAAQLTVTSNRQGAGQPQIADVHGLAFQHVGQSSQVQIINGAMSASVTHTYLVTAERVGDYTIPAIRIGEGRDAAASQPLTLKVRDGSAGTTPQRSGPYGTWRHTGPPPRLVPPTANVPGNSADGPEASGIGFLRIDSPKKTLFVGETVAVELQAFFREGADLRVDGLPKFDSDAFTMKKLGDQPLRRRELVNGIPYTVLAWPTAITAVKAGTHELALEIPTTVTIRVKTQRPTSRMRGLFGDSLFDHFFDDPFFNDFFGAATQKQVSLRSEPMAVDVAPLPAAGKPGGFGGAVGRFAISATATPTRANSGDPVALKVTVTGEGNFDRVNINGVERDGTWKSYKPTTAFEPGSGPLLGSKVFEQALVPLEGGRLEIPPVSFSYFDPEKREYATIATQPISIEVTPSGNPTPPVAAIPVASPNPASPAPHPGANEILPDKVETGWPVVSLVPWFLQPDRMAVALAPSLGALGLWAGLLWHRRRKNDVGRQIEAEARRRVREELAIMRGAAERGAAVEFFAAARDAFRHRLAARWGMPASAITLAEIDARCNGQASGFREIFELADEAIFAGRTFPPEMLKSWLRKVDDELDRLETTS